MPLYLLCIGFGYVDIKLKALINKVEISVNKNLIEKVKENLKKRYKFIEEIDESSKVDDKEDNRIEVKKESIDKFFRVLDDYIELLKTKNDLEDKEIFEKKITDFLKENNVESRFVIDLFIELFNQIQIRNKFENVLMRDSYLEIPREIFNEYIEKIVIYISYKDLMKNEYNDVEIPLEINDLRLEPQNTKIYFKVDVENIENKIFHNVEKIKRD